MVEEEKDTTPHRKAGEYILPLEAPKSEDKPLPKQKKEKVK